MIGTTSLWLVLMGALVLGFVMFMILDSLSVCYKKHKARKYLEQRLFERFIHDAENEQKVQQWLESEDD